MKINALLAASLLCAAASAGAQQDSSARASWLAKMGVTSSGDELVYSGPSGRVVLTADQARRLDEFEGTLEAAPDADAVLAQVDRRELDAEGRDPGSVSPEGEIWFEKAPGGWALTDAGRQAVPEILLKSSAASAATPAARPQPASIADLSLPSSRIQAVLGASAAPNFDGSAASASAGPAPAADRGFSSSLQPPLPDAPLPAKDVPDAPKPKAKPKSSPVERDLFWSSWWGYHAAFAADFTTTGMVLGRGGYETDHLYTQFGNKNMAGVIGSAVAVHAVASIASLALYKEAQKKHGVWRYALDAAAIGINGYGIGVHSWGAGHNVGVLDNWNK